MTQPIRVLELRSVWGTGGGPEKTILTGAKLSHPDIAVTVCYLRDGRDKTFALEERARQLGIEYLEIVEGHSFDLSLWRRLRHLVRDRQIDIVHAHEYKTDLLAYALAKFEPVTALATAHGWTGHSWRERRVYYPADRFLLSKFVKVVAVSGDIKKALLVAGARDEHVEVVLNGIDPEAFRRDPERRASARARLGLDPDDYVIGAVGRLEPQKRFDLLIDAVAMLRTDWPAVKLLVAGEGSVRGALERQIDRMNLGPVCRLLGHCSDVTELHHALDLFVQSSDYEGTPNAVLEAMALETPIVATTAGGTAQLCEQGVHALLVPPGNAQLLWAAINEALREPGTASVRATAARRRVQTELSFERRVRRIEAIYRSLVRSPGALGLA